MHRTADIARVALLLVVAIFALVACTTSGEQAPRSTATEALTAQARSLPAEAETTATAEPVSAAGRPSLLPVDQGAAVAPTATPTEPPHAATPTATPIPTLEPTDTPVAQATPQPVKPTATTQKAAAATTATKTATPRPTATTSKGTSGRVVGLDPGHHRLDIGGAALYNVKEYKLTMETALAVRQILLAKGYTVRLSRWTDNPVSSWSATDSVERVRIEQQARIAAVGKVDAYVSIHFNASPTHTLSGTETYYNAATAVGARSAALAKLVQANNVSRIRGAGYATIDRGARLDLSAGKSYGHFYSLSGPYPSALAESLFMDSPADAAALQKPAVRAAIARGIAEGIMAFLP